MHRTSTILARSVCALALLFAVATLPAPALAQDTAALETQREASRIEHARLTREITLSRERASEIEAEIADIDKDHASISAALVQAAKTERKLTQDVEDIQARMRVLGNRETALRSSLAARRGVLAQVLGALQRMGLNPPPAILVRPEDALSSVRSSILLASVVPELRDETEVLIADLRELGRIVASVDAERERLVSTVREQVEEQTRLSLLLEEKARLQSRSQEMLAAERTRATQLAEQAGSLLELIDAIEGEIEMAALAREEALGPVSPPVVLGSTPFSALTGQVSLPAPGRIGHSFGEEDESGAPLQGDMVATHSGAIVTAPVDAAVLYAGPFRSYGQLLILDAGDDYHVVLAGMGRISVVPGQSVLAGEPVGLMQEARLASATSSEAGAGEQELYVEFRKDGKPVDPSPWWSERNSGRTGNDT